jgi:hypothetical protein
MDDVDGFSPVSSHVECSLCFSSVVSLFESTLLS